MKKIFSPLGVLIIFIVGAFLSGFFGLWGEIWFDKIFGRESQPGTEKKMEQSGDKVPCEHCGLEILDTARARELHEEVCIKKK